jgi:Arm DNA-binding domain
MKLKDITVRNVRSTSNPQKFSDGGGLHLLVQPTGSKLWRLAYRFEGKQKTLALGIYPTVSLADARTGRDEAKKLLARSIDPSVQRKSDKRAGVGNSFREVAEELLAKVQREGRADVTLSKKRWLRAFAFPAFGDRPVGEITAHELLSLLRKLKGADYSKRQSDCAALAEWYSVTR